MKISELKALIANLPDNMEVVVSGKCRSYLPVGKYTKVVKAEETRDYLARYCGESNKLNDNNQVVDVLWIDDGRYL